MKNTERNSQDTQNLKKEIEALHLKLSEAQITIDLIKAGNIDALVEADKNRIKIFTEKTADQNYRTIVEKMHEGAVTLNQEGIILYSNSSFAEMLELPLQKVIGAKFSSFIADASETTFNALLKKGWEDNVKGEIHLNGNKSIVMPVLLSASTFMLNEHLVLSIILTDISILNSVQQELKLSSSHLEQNITELANANKEIANQNDELQQKNQEIALSFYNKRFLTQFSEQFSTYASHNDFFNSMVLYISDITRLDYVLVGEMKQFTEEDFLIRTVAIAAAGKLVENIEYPLPHGPCEQVTRGTSYSYPENCRGLFPKNQTLVQFNVEGYIGYPLYDIHGAAIGLIAVMHKKEIEDPETVTSILKIVAKRVEAEMERIRHEKLLAESNKALQEKYEELENTYKDLTFQIAEKKKRMADLSIANTNVKELEELVAHKDSILAILSHDLRSPLAGIIGTAEFLKSNFEDMDNVDIKEMLDLLYESSHKELNMLDYLVEWARIKYASDVFSPTKIELLEYVGKVFETLKDTAALNTINLHQEIEENTTVFADGKMLLSILQNIVSNAIKHSSPDGKITITAKRTDDEVIVEIKDTGIGMSEEIQKNLFTPQMSSLTEERKDDKGAGIGLLLVKGFLEKNGGRIWVESVEGVGSSFYFTLPINSPLNKI
ncbi:PAS domain-containing sensor histidine kinase [Flavobacterium sp. GT3R68]|uniref:sensor histidine kinase n=1 Tax=Flavobacterium sp. GT3R68 TaxID=2594437 RepID=UPI000F85F8BE|nr:PAS domain-containing sensor histidine kinase [Flavobacterium sp. GT3R68]RTY89832.1 PAS domain-containing protein [Flavobacterium sp. GSN2]TRW89811.1 PAS domain-containing protein [Flavobacterium sp. GT3R68]